VKFPIIVVPLTVGAILLAAPAGARAPDLLVPEQATRLAMVRTGEASIAAIGPEAIKEAEAGGMKIVTVPGTMQAVYQLWGLYRPEAEGSPLNDVRVREALSLAIDRQQIIDHVMSKYARWPMPYAVFPFSADVDLGRWEPWAKKAFRYDPARAKQLLAEAGHPAGFRMTFWNTALPGTPFITQVGEAVAGFWEKIGIKVDMRTVEFGVFNPMEREQKSLIGTVSAWAPRTGGVQVVVRVSRRLRSSRLAWKRSPTSTPTPAPWRVRGGTARRSAASRKVPPIISTL